MSLDQLRSFVAVAEEGTVRRAAARLHLTQPPVSRQICALEDELGAPLFVRVARGMQLSHDGARFLPHARRILALVDEAREAVQRDPAGRR